jgi:hypothetical protein
MFIFTPQGNFDIHTINKSKWRVVFHVSISEGMEEDENRSIEIV